MTMVKQKFYNHIQNYTPKFTPSYKTQGSHTYCAVCMGPLCLIYTLSQNSLDPTHTVQYVCDLVFCKRMLFIWGVVVASGQTVKLYFTPTLHFLSLSLDFSSLIDIRIGMGAAAVRSKLALLFLFSACLLLPSIQARKITYCEFTSLIFLPPPFVVNIFFLLLFP